MKKRLISLLLVVSLLVSMCPVRVRAAENVTVYLLAEHILPESQYDFAVWAWPNGGDGDWYLPDGPADADGCIAFQIPSDRPNVIFATFGEGSTPDWGNKIYQTSDLILDTAAPYFVLTSPSDGIWSNSACVHQWSSQVTVQPTCTATGTEVYTCGLCGYSYEQTLDLVEHNWQNDVCADCGTVKNLVYVAWEHMFPAAEYDCYAWIWPGGYDGRWVAPSAQQNVAGYTAFPVEDDDTYVIFAFFPEGQQPVWNTQVCQTYDRSASTTTCYHTLTEYVYGNDYVTGVTSTSEACEHDWVISKQTFATCTEGGYLEQSCALCAQHFTLDTLPTGHSVPPEDLTIVTPATCTATGEGTYVCEGCQETISVTIPALGHSCGEDGNCTICGELCAVKLTQEDGTVTYYLDLYTAYKAGSGYRQIELLQDAALYSTRPSESVVIYSGDRLLLDLNGHTLTVSSGSYGAFYLYGGNAAVQNGTIAIAGSNTKAFDLESGDLTLQSVTFTPAEGNNARFCYCVLNSFGSCTLYNVRIVGTIGYLLYHVSTSGSAVLNDCTTYDPSASAGANVVYAGSGAQLTINGGRYQYIQTVEALSAALAEGYCYRYIDGSTYASGNEYVLNDVEVAQVPLVPTVSQHYESTVGQPLTITPTYAANIEDFDPSSVTYHWDAPISNVAYTENEDGGITLTVSAAGTQYFYLTYGYKGYTKVVAIEISVSVCTNHNYNDNGICTYCKAYKPSYTQDAEGCYLIGNAAEYMTFVALVNSTQPGANAKLTADIDLTGLSVVPMGSDAVPYTGIFDGQGHTLSNVSCIGAAKYWGLFAFAQDAAIQNLGVTGIVRNTYSQASDTSNTAGILVIGRGGCIIRNCWTDLTVEGGTSTAGIVSFIGERTGGGLIENCHVKGVVRCVITDAAYGSVAGIAGTYDGTIRDCTNEAQIIGLDEFAASGIAIQGAGTIENCVNKGSVSTGADGIAAGIIEDLTGLAQNCVNEGTIYAPSGYRVGGIAARNHYLTEVQVGTIRNCTNLGAVTGGQYTGGITGYAEGPVQACVNLGAVTAGDNANVGGIAGYAMSCEMRDCGNQGSVTGGASANVGGIVGDGSRGTVYNSYNAGTVTAGEESYAHPIGIIIDTNCCYLSDTETESGGRTAEQFASGQVAYELNGSAAEETSVWKQTLGTDAYPVLSGPLVYYGELCQCDGTSLGEGYSNSAPGTLPDHTYGENGLCTLCGHSGVAAELVNGVYQIDTAAKLLWFAQEVNGGSNTLHAVLTADIDLSILCGADLRSWVPVSNFRGTFDGQGHTISNLYVDTGALNAGLFGDVWSATIQNLGVTGSVTGSCVYNGATYEPAAAGGIVGYANGSTLRDCWVDMAVSGGNLVGGICGWLDGGLIQDCTARGTVQCPDATEGTEGTVGGLAGVNMGGTVSGCANHASVSTPFGYAGGIAGQNKGSGAIIVQCLNLGSILDVENGLAAGIVGENYEGTIRSCGNRGAVSGSATYTAGIVSRNSYGYVENCYNANDSLMYGSIVEAEHGTTTNCYYLSDTETTNGGRTSEQFASGQVAYELNGGVAEETSVWRQTIGTDAYPAFTGELVYYGTFYQCDGTSLGQQYSNTQPGAVPDHTYGEHDICTVCRHSNTPALDSDGNGYYEIDTAAKLWWFTQQVNGGKNGLNAVLTADIDLTGTCGEGIGSWTPISNGYSGHFNGQGFTISNLYMTGNEQYIGLFGYVRGATIENVSLTGSVSSTFNFDENTLAEGAAGGIAAHLDGGTIRSCHVDMTVSGEYCIGGICGELDSGGIIDSCTSRGSVINPGVSDGSGQYVGGIVGRIWGETCQVRNCTNYAAVSKPVIYGAYMGGIAGQNLGTLENCINFSDIIGCEGGYNALGGITECNGPSGTIRNCANYGNVSGYDVGGIVCDNVGTVENCYNVGTVSGASGRVAGPISGINQGDGTTNNNYYLSDTETEDGGRTSDQFASGQVAYELNGSTTAEENVWRQTIGTDAYPVFDGLLVYYGEGFTCDGNSTGVFYHNSQPDTSVPPHRFTNGLCTACGGYEAPEHLDGVYQIANGGNLFWFAQAVNGGESGANAVLTADIDLENREWAPIDNYSGTFNGAGHSISGFAITEYNSETLVVDNKAYIGLFGSIQSPAVVQSFTLNGRIALNEGGSTEGYLGAAVAASGQDNQHNGGTITGITSNVTIVTGAGYTLSHGGGVAGALYGGSISQCIFTGSLSSNGGKFNEVGGVVGYCQDTLIENCGFYGSVTVTGSNHAGGILGYVNNSGAIIRNNLSLGSVTGCKGQYVGAIIGRANSNCAAANGYNNYYSTVNVLYGIGSGSSGMSNDTAATSKPTEAFYSGEVTLLLNGGTEGVWKQSLTGDSLPGFSGDPVYLQNVYSCDGIVLSQVYTNTPGDGTIPGHTLDENGLCANCGLQCEALVTIGGQTTGYATLQEALTKAQEGTAENRALVTVCVDLNMDIDWINPPMLTPTMNGGYAILDLNGHAFGFYSSYGLKLTGTNLIIRDSSQAQTGQLYNWNGYGVYADRDSYVELQSGTVGSYLNKGGIYLGNGSEGLQTDGKLLGQVRAVESSYTMQGGEILSSGRGVFATESTIVIQDGTITAGTWLFTAYDCENLTITGGTFATSNGINVIDLGYSKDFSVISIQGGTFQGGVKTQVDYDGSVSLASLLAQGYAFRAEDGSFVNLTADQSEVAQTVTVAQAPMYIADQPQDVTMQTTDAVRLFIGVQASASSNTNYYEWFREGEAEAVGTKNVLELVAPEAGTYQYYCVVTHADTGYQVVSQTATVTVTECSHSLDGNACCTLCVKQMAASLTAGDQTTYYPQAWVALHKANETTGAIVTLLTDIDCEDWGTAITGTMTLDLNGKTWTLQHDYFDLYSLRAYGLSIDGGTLTIRDSLGGGKLTSTYQYGGTVTISNAGKVILEGGTIENTADKPAVYMEQSSFTQTGGAVVTVGAGNAIEAENSQLSLEGGSTQGGFALFAMSSTVSVTGGTHTGVVLLGMSEGTITGGTFYPLSAEGLIASLISLESNLAITGGSFPQGIYATDFDGVPVPLAPVLAEGYAFYQNGTPVTLTEGQTSIDGAVTVAQAQAASVTIGGTVTEYPTLQEAFQAAASGTEANPATVTLLRDVELVDNAPGFIWAAGVGSFDLNGHSVSRIEMHNAPADGSRLYILRAAGGQLTIQDSVGQGKLASYYGSAKQVNHCTVILDGGTLTLQSGTLYAEDAYTLYLLEGTFQMNGGTLQNDNSNDAVIYQDTDSQSVQVEIHGGTITGVMGMLLQGNAQVEITGGIIHGEACLVMQLAGSLDISGGTFQCPSPAEMGMLLWMPEVNATITGGTFQNGFHAVSAVGESIGLLDLNTLLPQGYGFQKADGSWITLTSGQTQITEAVTVGRVPEILSVSITWGELDFFYDPGDWNPDTLSYSGGEWKPIQSDGRTITVENTGNVAVNVTLDYTAAEGYGYISGSFAEAGAYLAAQEEKKFYLLLTGKPQESISHEILGTVTVTIGGE